MPGRTCAHGRKGCGRTTAGSGDVPRTRTQVREQPWVARMKWRLLPRHAGVTPRR